MNCRTVNDSSSRQPEGDKSRQRELFEQLWKYLAVGIEMGAAVGIGAGIGIWLDKRFGTEPWLLLVFLLLGIAAAFRAFFRLVREVSPSRKDK
jgi:ATP synthase protein I